MTLLPVASFLLINGASVLTGYRTESWIPEKVLKFAQQFSRLGKSLENRDKVRKNGTKSWGFFKATTLALQVNFFVFVLVKSYSISASYFCRALWIKLCSCFFKRSILIIFDNLESGKGIIVLDKGLEKVLNFGSKTLYGPWLYLLKWKPNLGPCTWSRGYFSMYTALKRFGTLMSLLKLHLNWSLWQCETHTFAPLITC